MVRIFSKNWIKTNFSKVLLVTLIVIVVSVASVYAYLEFLLPQSGPRVTILSQPLEFSMEMDKTEFRQGENITIRLSVKNVGNQTITLRWSSFYLHYDVVLYFDFYVLDMNNTVVFQWSKIYGRFPAVREKTLTPGEQLINVYVWGQWSELEGQVPKGVYSVRGLTRQVALIVGDQTSTITLETPTITFTIT